MPISEVQAVTDLVETDDENRVDKKALIIREAELADCPDIVRIWRDGCMISAGIPAPPLEKALEAFSRRLQSSKDQSRLWVAESDGTVLGWQALSLGGGTQIVPTGMSSTYVDPSCQAKGIGRELLKHAQEESPAMGLWCLLGWVKADNNSSINLVRSLGWRLLGRFSSQTYGRPEYDWYAYDVPPT
jgi:L-amino acid N-acyltransferase YncA